MQKNFINQVLVRIKSSSPSFFKKLQVLFFGLAGIIIVLIFLEPLHINLHGFEGYVNWNTFIVLLGFAGVNMLPVSDSGVLEKKATAESDPDKPRPKPGDEDYDPNNP